jgi:hypothetical protein
MKAVIRPCAFFFASVCIFGIKLKGFQGDCTSLEGWVAGTVGVTCWPDEYCTCVLQFADQVPHSSHLACVRSCVTTNLTKVDNPVF